MARRKKSFAQTKPFGTLGEQFVFDHFHELCNADLVLNNTITADKNIAGEIQLLIRPNSEPQILIGYPIMCSQSKKTEPYIQ